jgi:hypothetical protein
MSNKLNRKQRRAAEKMAGRVKSKNVREHSALTYEQGIAIASDAYKKGQDIADTERANIFMYTMGLIIKVLHEQWGWGYIRIGRLVNQILEEYNDNDMTMQELQQWCWDFGGFKLQIEDEIK